MVAVVLGELALRATGFNAPLWYQPDARLGWAMRPNVQGWFTKEGRAYAQINAAGFRDRAHPQDKPQGVYRIAVLGDSVVEAFQVDLEATFWRQLEKELQSCAALAGRALEVMGFGVSGYGTAQQQLLLETTAIRYRPDFVLLAFAPNDLRNNSATLEPENERPFYRLEGDALKLDASFTKHWRFMSTASRVYEGYRSALHDFRVVQLVEAARHGVSTWRQAGAAHAKAEHITGVEPTTPGALFAPPRNAAWEEAWTITERLIVRMNEYAAANAARFAVAVISHSAQVHPDPLARKHVQDALGVQDLIYIERRMQALGERQQIPVVALAPELQRLADSGKTYFHGFKNYRMGWGHWNEQGHRTAAALIAPRICASL